MPKLPWKHDDIIIHNSMVAEDTRRPPSVLRIVRAIVSPFNVYRYWAKRVGHRAALTWCVFRAKKSLGFKEPGTLKIRPRQARYPVTARLGGSSDMNVFHQIFKAGEYDCIPIPPPRLILDLGANVGYSSAYFLSRFPAAAVVAVEPDPDNWKLCRKNLAPYGDRAKVILGAVWSKHCRLALHRALGDLSEWGTQVHACENSSREADVEGWDIPSILDLAGETQIDLLKVDIEGSELEIFGAGCSSWLSKVRNICIELHGQECRDVFFNALKEFDYDSGSSGELTVCLNLRPKSRSHQQLKVG